MDFIAHDSTLGRNPETKVLYEHLQNLAIAGGRQGRCFYRYPLWDQANQYIPDIVILDAEYGLFAIDVLPIQLAHISQVTDATWEIQGKQQDSPLLALEDFTQEMTSLVNSMRALRRKVKTSFKLCLPYIDESQFLARFPDADVSSILFSDYNLKRYEDLWPDRSTLSAELSELFIAVAQGDGTLNSGYVLGGEAATAPKMGDAISLIDRKIRSLDISQLKPEIQVPDGPQRLRGLAGTGKTIILAKRAALLHNILPEAKILYTFHTQSLYNIVYQLITDSFPRGFSVTGKTRSIDWDKLLVRHSFGGKTTREGVYYRTCIRNSITPKSNFGDLESVCAELLQYNLIEEFDYVLIDEAQDLPPSFFQLIWRITKPVDPQNPKSPKRIIFAYDELQSLTDSLDIKDSNELFGFHSDGSSKVDFSAGVYPDGIEMDYVLKKTYRNPFELLMVAHGLGLGLYNRTGEMQMTEKRSTWEAIGYKVDGELSPGQEVTLTRDPSDSRSLVREVYSGSEPVLKLKRCLTREEEIQLIHDSIVRDVTIEGVKPEDIVVIALETSKIDQKFRPLQHMLWMSGIPSIIPGVGEVERDKFAEKGKITLSTVFRVKGNEAFIVYIMYFDYLYRSFDFVNVRNRAFTSISRTKGWCRIFGVGPEMERAIEEISKIQAKIPSFVFPFPPSEKIKRSLSREELAHTRRRKKDIVDALSSLKEENELVSESEAMDAVKTLGRKIPKEDLRRLLEELQNENQ